MTGIMEKSGEEKSTHSYPVREPWKVRVGTAKRAEHGLGAGPSIGRRLRVRPLSRVEAAFAANQGGTAYLYALGISRGVFFIRRGRCPHRPGRMWASAPTKVKNRRKSNYVQHLQG